MSQRFVRGMDVSKWQSPIQNFQAAPDEGLEFVYYRSGCGTDYPDPARLEMFTGYGKVGLLRGSYQWYKPSQNPLDQARKFVGDGLVEQCELPPAGDFEDITGMATKFVMYLLKEINRLRAIAGMKYFMFQSVLNYADNVRMYLAEIERLSKRRPIIYSAQNHWETYLAETATWADNYSLWVSNPRKNAGPSVPFPWCPADWDIWQWIYKGKGKRFGVGSLDLDMDIFNGSRDELEAWERAHRLEESYGTDIKFQRIGTQTHNLVMGSPEPCGGVYPSGTEVIW